MADIGELLKRIAGNDPAAVDQLSALLYEDLRRMAHVRLLGNSPLTLLDTTSLANEAYLRLRNAAGIDVTNRAQFMAYVSKVLRAVIVDFARRRSAERRGGQAEHVSLDAVALEPLQVIDPEVERLTAALDVLEKTDPRLKQVVEMRYFAGMNDAEIAEVLGVTPRTVGRDWVRAKLLLSVELRDDV
jgi:RNA polymerase sigma factor (TIGR02999 family)